MAYAYIIRGRLIYGVPHIVRSHYLCGILIWRVTKPSRNAERPRRLYATAD
jgi:hypothetical protein